MFDERIDQTLYKDSVELDIASAHGTTTTSGIIQGERKEEHVPVILRYMTAF